MIRADTPATLLILARSDAGLTLAQAAQIAGLRGRSSCSQRESPCSPRVASRLLTALHGAPWVCVEGPGWAVAGPADDVRTRLATPSPTPKTTEPHATQRTAHESVPAS